MNLNSNNNTARLLWRVPSTSTNIYKLFLMMLAGKQGAGTVSPILCMEKFSNRSGIVPGRFLIAKNTFSLFFNVTSFYFLKF